MPGSGWTTDVLGGSSSPAGRPRRTASPRRSSATCSVASGTTCPAARPSAASWAPTVARCSERVGEPSRAGAGHSCRCRRGPRPGATTVGAGEAGPSAGRPGGWSRRRAPCHRRSWSRARRRRRRSVMRSAGPDVVVAVRGRGRVRAPRRALTARAVAPGRPALGPGVVADWPVGQYHPPPSADPRPDPVLGVPADRRGRPGAPRAQALRGARARGRRGPRPHPRRRRTRRARSATACGSTASPSRRPRATSTRSSPGCADERRHARGRRASSAEHDFDLVHGHDWLVAPAARRARRRALGVPLRDDDPRDRARPPPGLGRQAPAVAHPRASSAGWPAAPTG